jgi:hypothetical protein
MKFKLYAVFSALHFLTSVTALADGWRLSDEKDKVCKIIDSPSYIPTPYQITRHLVCLNYLDELIVTATLSGSAYLTVGAHPDPFTVIEGSRYFPVSYSNSDVLELYVDDSRIGFAVTEDNSIFFLKANKATLDKLEFGVKLQIKKLYAAFHNGAKSNMVVDLKGLGSARMHLLTPAEVDSDPIKVVQEQLREREYESKFRWMSIKNPLGSGYFVYLEEIDAFATWFVKGNKFVSVEGEASTLLKSFLPGVSDFDFWKGTGLDDSSISGKGIVPLWHVRLQNFRRAHALESLMYAIKALLHTAHTSNKTFHQNVVAQFRLGKDFVSLATLTPEVWKAYQDVMFYIQYMEQNKTPCSHDCYAAAGRLQKLLNKLRREDYLIL